MKFKNLYTILPEAKKEALTKSTTKNSNSNYFKIIEKEMPKIIRDYINNNDDFFVQGSIGKGIMADVAWICILSSNPLISPSVTKGIYIGILFNKICDSFYLCLTQGITNEKFNNKKTFINTVNYFQKELKDSNLIKDGFNFEKINLGENISNRAKKYTSATIISKKFSIDSFDEKNFFTSLYNIVNEYQDIIEAIGDKSYDEIIDLISPIDGIVSFSDAMVSIKNVKKIEYNEPRDIKITPILVNKGDLKPKKYIKLSSQKIYKKTDYIEKAKENIRTGLSGEELVLDIERKKVEQLGYDPNECVFWASNESDSLGYDIKSIDVINGNKKEIFIEVKTTTDRKDTSFFVSRNEVETSKKKKEAYKIYRIFDITSINPKYYIASGEIEENFFLDPVTYSATYKYNLDI